MIKLKVEGIIVFYFYDDWKRRNTTLINYIYTSKIILNTRQVQSFGMNSANDKS